LLARFSALVFYGIVVNQLYGSQSLRKLTQLKFVLVSHPKPSTTRIVTMMADSVTPKTTMFVSYRSFKLL
jgi:hypothetical protein